jgi:hypothetical protein
VRLAGPYGGVGWGVIRVIRSPRHQRQQIIWGGEAD